MSPRRLFTFGTSVVVDRPKLRPGPGSMAIRPGVREVRPTVRGWGPAALSYSCRQDMARQDTQRTDNQLASRRYRANTGRPASSTGIISTRNSVNMRVPCRLYDHCRLASQLRRQHHRQFCTVDHEQRALCSVLQLFSLAPMDHQSVTDYSAYCQIQPTSH